MVTINAILSLNGDEIVPVRAIPFVTGGDMSPKCLVGILSDPTQQFWAYVSGSNGTVTPMLPKNWKPYKDGLSAIGRIDLDLIDRTALELLPASTFVYWKSLWRNHENNFLPPREVIADCTLAEQENYELQPCALIPTALVDLVFEGFSSLPKVKPISRSAAQDQEILSALATRGFAAKSLPKNAPGRSGVKAVVRQALGNSGMWGGARVFNKAWERLLKNGDIVTKP